MLVSRSTFCTWTGDFYCKVKPSVFEQWQIDTYNAVMDAYNQRVKEFQNALAQAQALRGVDIRGTNPAINRQLEQQELKKGCIEWLYDMGLNGSNAMVPNTGQDDCNPPGEYSLCESQMETLTQLRFAEQALDWKLMTYRFYPYFWANKCRWKRLYQLDDVDPLFLNFLQAGYARVLVPVSEGYEKLVMYFLQNGCVFPFEDSPIIGGDLAENMLRDLMPEHLRDGATKLPLTWKLRVPTTLTALQCGSGCIEGDGLPCDCHKPGAFNKSQGIKLMPVISKEDAVINVSKGPVAQNTLQIKR
jgi:hypothetical protein